LAHPTFHKQEPRYTYRGGRTRIEPLIRYLLEREEPFDVKVTGADTFWLTCGVSPEEMPEG
jgi:hypothetical protein